ncbi:hypothetical protein NA57DRAFT_56555 [Rhizodiscina lignyota]|uniref:Uncharacterized protein n=1 Tax=Rhizodiscina lignyota TaxID=1504668 RepID=A0A9P4M6I6_9PEZI|nr:hypothetical protein NA57DRAFT_56555 [Rhizodiscina lignyota]
MAANETQNIKQKLNEKLSNLCKLLREWLDHDVVNAPRPPITEITMRDGRKHFFLNTPRKVLSGSDYMNLLNGKWEEGQLAITELGEVIEEMIGPEKENITGSRKRELEYCLPRIWQSFQEVNQSLACQDRNMVERALTRLLMAGLLLDHLLICPLRAAMIWYKPIHTTVCDDMPVQVLKYK